MLKTICLLTFMQYSGEEAVFSVETGELIVGSLPKKPTRLVQAWVELHHDELIENYNLLQKETGSFKKIKPLQ